MRSLAFWSPKFGYKYLVQKYLVQKFSPIIEILVRNIYCIKIYN